KATSETIGLRNALFYAMTGEPFKGKKAADMGLVNESVPRKNLKKRTTKNQAVLRGIKIAMKRMRYMDWDASADYLYAKMGEALFFGASDNRANAMKAFLDDKTFKPGLEHFKKTKESAYELASGGAGHAENERWGTLRGNRAGGCRLCLGRARATHSPRARLQRGRARRAADRGLADERRQLVQPALFAADR